jgi:tetratricopeptide (TPR) repeat protein
VIRFHRKSVLIARHDKSIYLIHPVAFVPVAVQGQHGGVLLIGLFFKKNSQAMKMRGFWITLLMAVVIGVNGVLIKNKEARERHNEGMDLARQKNLTAALVSYSAAIQLSQNDTDPTWHLAAFYNRGMAWNHLNQFDESMADFTRVIEGPDTRRRDLKSRAYRRRAYLYDRSSRIFEAGCDFALAAKHAVDDAFRARCYTSCALRLFIVGKYRDAVEAFKQSGYQDEKLGRYLVSWANRRAGTESALTDSPLLIRIYSTALEYVSERYNVLVARMGRGLAYFRLNDYAAANVDFTAARDLLERGDDEMLGMRIRLYCVLTNTSDSPHERLTELLKLLEHVRLHHSRLDLALTLESIGNQWMALKHYGNAIVHLSECIDIWRDLDRHDGSL